jgi:titin
MGSRLRASHDFGFVTLDITKCIPEDSGMYVIKAKNLSGESSSSFAVHVGGGGGILGESMHPESYKKLARLEEEKCRPAEDEVDATPDQPPVFMEQLASPGPVVEGQAVHLAARLEPRGDPALRVEWEVNGKVLNTGNRQLAEVTTKHCMLRRDSSLTPGIDRH